METNWLIDIETAKLLTAMQASDHLILPFGESMMFNSAEHFSIGLVIAARASFHMVTIRHAIVASAPPRAEHRPWNARCS